MKFPIFIIDDNDVDLFSSIETLSDYIESYDLDDNLAIDAEGVRLKLTLKNSKVIVTDTAEKESLSEFLSEKITGYIQVIEPNINIHNVSLDDLVSLGIEKIGYS